MKTINEIISKFRQEGYKITPQRRAIFEILLKNGNHPHTEDIYNELKGIMPDISLTTVYNTLNELTNLGIIDVVQNIGEDSIRFDPKTETHHHLYCLRCKRIIDIEVQNSDIDLPEEMSFGFQLLKKQTTYFGYCPDCQKIDK